jgi:predicted metal-dependent RNase
LTVDWIDTSHSFIHICKKMTSMKVVPLGAGQDVGRSCVIVSLGGKNIMFDCGMHMGYQDERRFPDFSFLSQTGRFDQIIDCVIISHLYPLALPSFLIFFFFYNRSSSS